MRIRYTLRYRCGASWCAFWCSVRSCLHAAASDCACTLALSLARTHSLCLSRSRPSLCLFPIVFSLQIQEYSKRETRTQKHTCALSYTHTHVRAARDSRKVAVERKQVPPRMTRQWRFSLLNLSTTRPSAYVAPAQYHIHVTVTRLLLFSCIALVELSLRCSCMIAHG